jgi:hypothetical protein
MVAWPIHAWMKAFFGETKRKTGFVLSTSRSTGIGDI